MPTTSNRAIIADILKHIDESAIKKLKRYGKQFGYVLIVTEELPLEPPNQMPAHAVHIVHNGYGPQRGGTEENLQVKKVIEDAAQMIGALESGRAQ